MESQAADSDAARLALEFVDSYLESAEKPYVESVLAAYKTALLDLDFKEKLALLERELHPEDKSALLGEFAVALSQDPQFNIPQSLQREIRGGRYGLPEIVSFAEHAKSLVTAKADQSAVELLVEENFLIVGGEALEVEL